MKGIISDDRTGNKILKIFEAITNSEIDDKDFYFLDRRKAVLFADYFVDNKVTIQEEANYIIMRGKNKQGLEIVKEASGGHSLPESELRKLRIRQTLPRTSDPPPAWTFLPLREKKKSNCS